MILFSLIPKWQTHQAIIYAMLLLIKFELRCKIYNCNVNVEEDSVKAKRPSNSSRLLYLTDLSINSICIYTL